MKVLVFTFLISLSCYCHASKIQWASYVAFQYNEYGSGDYSAKKVLGKPDALPHGELNRNAFRLNTEKGFGKVKVGFNNPQFISQVFIVENYMPGRIVKVILFDAEDNEYIIYEESAKNLDKRYNLLTITIPKTRFKVVRIEAQLNTYMYPGWAQIDAIGISEQPVENPTISSISNETSSEYEEYNFVSKKERMSNNVNSKYIESKPLISPDGKTLYFARKYCPDNYGGKRDDQDIYFSHLIGNTWSEAKNISTPLNDRLPNGICSVSPDGNMIMVINAYNEDGTVDDGVSVSRKTRQGWSWPEKQIIENYHNRSQFQDYFQSNSGMALLMSLERRDSYGDQDIYVSFRTGENNWSSPINLGSVINTPKVEFAPFLASDNKTLYFASNGHDGFGESDIFYSRRLDETWQNWTTPVNLGIEVNTPDWDGYYAVSAKGDYAYFISNGGLWNDIDMNPNNEDIYRIALAKEAQPDPVILVKGKVMDAQTNQPIIADIFYESMPSPDEDGMAVSDPVNGDYQIVLPIGKKYNIRVFAEGYISLNHSVDYTDTDEYQEETLDLKLTPLEVGQVVQLNNIFFVQSKPEMLSESLPELDRLYELLVKNPTLEIELSGHTDNQGLSSANLRLSEERARAVMDFLINKGIPKKRLVAVGYGASRPVASNAYEESRKKNRRVEIKILNL